MILISLNTSNSDVMTYQEFHFCLLSTEDVYASMSTMLEDVPSFPFYMETLPVVLPQMYNKWAWHHCCCRYAIDNSVLDNYWDPLKLDLHNMTNTRLAY